MTNKRNSGMTLIELLLAMALLSIVVAAAGSALVAGTRAYSLNYKMENDQHNTSMFLLEITRKIHMGVSDVAFDGGVLTLTDMEAPANVTEYKIIGGEVYMDGEPRGIKLSSFTVGVSGDARITITATGEYGMELTTTVARHRLPAGADGSGD